MNQPLRGFAKPPVLVRRSLSLALILLSFSCATNSIPRHPLLIVYPTELPNQILHNPDMGWVLYENYPLDHRPGGSSTLLTLPDEPFENVDHVAVMFAWSDIETTPGVYDFSKTDHAYDYWRARGKTIQLRMSTETLLWWNRLTPPAGVGVPQYVLDKLPPEKKQTRRNGGIPYVVVDARDAFYLERLKQFLSAVAAHFADDRPVSLIDLRGFGLWGEWHSGFRYASLANRRAGLTAIIDRYANAFPRHWLALSYSHDPDGPPEYFAGPTDRYDASFTRTYADFLRYSAFDYAMTKPNVTLRRDGAGGAVYSNQRRLCEVAFATLAKGPMMSEFVVGYSDAKIGGRAWLEAVLNDALSLHPNYINLLGWTAGDALAFTREQPELFTKTLNTMGYRLVPRSISYPRAIRNGGKFTCSMTWLNRGVGRAMRDYHLRFLAIDSRNEITSSCDIGEIPTSQWIKGKEYETTVDLSFANLSRGRYTLRLALIDPASNSTIALPLANAAEDGSYGVGEIDCRQ
jgi:hypothetical protein